MRIAGLMMGLVLGLVPMTGVAQEVNFGRGAFEANFQIDSIFTADGKTYEVSASGDAGPYGRAYLSYVFTDQQKMGNQGEFTGFAWTQKDEQEVTATLQGVYRKEGEVYRLYSLDNVSNGKINVVSGVADFAAKTMKLSVSELEIPKSRTDIGDIGGIAPLNLDAGGKRSGPGPGGGTLSGVSREREVQRAD